MDKENFQNENLKLVETFEGWLTQKEMIALYNLAKQSEGLIVEIGSWKGKSTSCLALGSLDGNNVLIHAIDPFTGSTEHMLKGETTYKEFKNNISKLPEQTFQLIIPFITTSELKYSSYFDKEIKLLFIDGAHDLISVMRDFSNYYQKVADDGIIVLHDFGVQGWAGPTHLGECLIKEFEDCEIIDSLLIIKKNKFLEMGSWN